MYPGRTMKTKLVTAVLFVLVFAIDDISNSVFDKDYYTSLALMHNQSSNFLVLDN